jgi:mRNA-degrading endonuclease toxin of MazEF toxin-antitoxin module
MRGDVQRGGVLYLTAEAHGRLLPDDPEKKIGKRPFLVVQSDIQNHASSYTVVVPLTTAGSSGPMVAPIPKGKGVAYDSFADCAAPIRIREQDIKTVCVGNYHDFDGVMERVDNALRLALDLDPDGLYRSKMVRRVGSKTTNKYRSKDGRAKSYRKPKK